MTVSDLESKKREAFDLLRSIVTKGRLKRGYKKDLKLLKNIMKEDEEIKKFIVDATASCRDMCKEINEN